MRVRFSEKLFVYKSLRLHFCHEFGFREALFNGVSTIENCLNGLKGNHVKIVSYPRSCKAASPPLFNGGFKEGFNLKCHCESGKAN